MTCSLDSLMPIAKRLRLTAMLNHAIALEQQIETASMSHADYLSTLFRHEVARRDESAGRRRLQAATFRYADACIGGIDWTEDRGLDRGLINNLSSNDYIRFRQNVIITGATGCGKTWLADALGHTACVAGFKVRHYNVLALLKEYQRLNNNNSVIGQKQYLSDLRKIDLLILDDWGMGVLDDTARISLYDIIENHMQHGSCIVTSVLPVKQWKEYINEPMIADSILDRLVVCSHRIQLTGDSMRSKSRYGGLQETMRKELESDRS